MFITATTISHEPNRSVAANYHGALGLYARLKLRHDPIYSTAAELLTAADEPVLDVGCGIGLLGTYLRARGFNRPYYGIDSDAKKIAQAQRSAGDGAPMLNYETRDAILLPSFRGSVALLDVLHYLDREHQRALLRAAIRRVACNGVLVIRTAMQEPAWRYRASVWEERLLHSCGWVNMPARHFPERAEIESALADLHADIQIKTLWGHTPFASFLVIISRRQEQ